MGRIVSLTNQKGGVGKTTTAINLACALGLLDWPTLLVDTDPQGNASSGVGVMPDPGGPNLYRALSGEIGAHDAIVKTPYPNLHLIPSSPDLVGLEVELSGAQDRSFRLRRLLDRVRGNFSFIVIDCPPSLGIMTVNAMATSDAVLLPLQAEYYALEGLASLIKTLNLVRRRLNSILVIDGVIITMYDVRNRICHTIEREVRDHFRGKVFMTVIHRNVKLSESPSFGKPIFFYDKNSRGAQDYWELALEYLQRLGLPSRGRRIDLKERLVRFKEDG